MAVERALGLAGGAGGVAEGSSSPLVEFGPLEILVLGRNQRLVTGEAREAGRGLGALFGHQYDPALRRELRRQPLDQRDKARIDEKQPVRGMIDDVDDLFIEEPRVDRVADCADAGDRVIKLEMAKGVPGERPDAVAGLDSQPQQRAGEPFGSALGLAIGIAVDRRLRQFARRFRYRDDKSPRA